MYACARTHTHTIPSVQGEQIKKNALIKVTGYTNNEMI